MKLLYKILTTLLFILNSKFTIAQTKAMKIGEKMPNIIVSNVFNSSINSIDLTKQNGKIIILDFWNTYCSSCISGLAKMDSLQKKYNDQIVIIPVATQSKEVVTKFWRTNHITKKLNLPTLFEDTTLKKLFPHNGVPYLIWINKNGIFQAATNSEYINEKEIQAVLKGNISNWIQVPLQSKIDLDEKLLKFEKANTKAYYSAFTNYLSNKAKTDFKYTIDSVKRTIRIICINGTIQTLYHLSLSDLPELQYPKMQTYNINDKSKLKYDKSYGYKTKWDAENKYCYELFWPLDSSLNIEKAFQKMRSDLDAYFGYRSEIIPIKTDAFILVRTNKGPIITEQKSSGRLLIAKLIETLNQDSFLPFFRNGLTNSSSSYIQFDSTKSHSMSELRTILSENGIILKKINNKVNHFLLND